MRPQLKLMDPWYYSHSRGCEIVPRSYTGKRQKSQSKGSRGPRSFGISGTLSDRVGARSIDHSRKGPR